MNGYIHSTESFGSVDGPGVRFVIFMSGCHMRCKYCHNPDTWDIAAGKITDAETLVKRALRCKPYWGVSGGVTVSGGEPLIQPDFLIELFKKLKAEGVHTAIDTSGAPFTTDEPFFSKFNELMAYTDLLLVDIKHMDNKIHKKLTGKDNTNIFMMLKYLSQIKKPVWIRHVLLPAWSDSNEHLNKMRDFISNLSNVERVEILPYHKMGIHKWEELNLKYELYDLSPPTEDDVVNAERILNI